MRKVFWIMFTFVALGTSAQTAVGEQERQAMIEQVCVAAGKLTSLQCDFTQVKHLSLLATDMTSTGKMYYKGGRLLRWEYTAPYTYVFVMNGDKVMMQSQGKTDVVDVKSSRMFQQIARIMMNSITGHCLSDTEDFNVTLYTDKGEWLAHLVPQQKELAQLFQYVRLHIDPQEQMVTAVDLVEKSGDTTRIRMKNIRKNGAIDDAVFAVE